MRSNHPFPFSLILAAALSITVASGGTAIYLANQPQLSEQQGRLFDAALSICTLGATSTIGLLGSRKPENQDGDD